MSKPRVVKDYDKLPVEIHEQLHAAFPRGFQKFLITFKGPKGKFVSALPFEAEKFHYLIRMTQNEAIEIHNQLEEEEEDDHIIEEVVLDKESNEKLMAEAEEIADS